MWLNVGAVAAGYAVMAVLVRVPMFAWVALRVPGGVAAMRARMKSALAAAAGAGTTVALVARLVGALP